MGMVYSSSGHLAAREVEQFVLDKNDGIVLADRAREQALGVVRCGRRDHDQTRHLCEPRFETLRVLCAVPASAALLGANHNRNRDCSARHVAQFAA